MKLERSDLKKLFSKQKCLLDVVLDYAAARVRGQATVNLKDLAAEIVNLFPGDEGFARRLLYEALPFHLVTRLASATRGRRELKGWILYRPDEPYLDARQALESKSYRVLERIDLGTEEGLAERARIQRIQRELTQITASPPEMSEAKVRDYERKLRARIREMNLRLGQALAGPKSRE